VALFLYFIHNVVRVLLAVDNRYLAPL